MEDGRKIWETRTALRRIGRGGASAVDKLLYLFAKDQTENYRNETNQRPPLRTEQETHKYYSHLMKSKVKKMGDSEDHGDKNSNLFVSSDEEDTKVPRKRRAISKVVSEETMKLEIISLQRQMAAILQNLNNAKVPGG